MTEYVNIQRAKGDYPVYHRSQCPPVWNPEPPVWNPEGSDRDEPHPCIYQVWVNDWYEQMACGVKMTLCAVMLQRDWAGLIARPCLRCFPEEKP